MSPSHPTENYQVIARKYRPQTFADVIGQESIVTTLKNALQFQRVAHAYLFCGCRGTGKTTLARVFSKSLNCQKLSRDFEPCNECQSCIEISQSHSLDVMEIDGASHRGIDDIRQINETIGYAPSSGRNKIYIIDEVHMLTKEAFNALLKTLEEPPANVKFIFATTEPHKVLQTILSRCQRFDLNRIPIPLIQEKLKKIAHELSIHVEEDALLLIAKISEGSLRDAESLLDQVICYNDSSLTVENVSSSLGIVSANVLFELDEAVQKTDLSYGFALADKVFSSGKDLSYFLDSLLEHFRTILAFQLDQPVLLTTFNQQKYSLSAKQIYTQDQILYILEYLVKWSQELSRSSFKRINLEMVLLHIIRSKQRVPVDTLIKRLYELKQHIELANSVQTKESFSSTPLVNKESKTNDLSEPTPPPISVKVPDIHPAQILSEPSVISLEVKPQNVMEKSKDILPSFHSPELQILSETPSTGKNTNLQKNDTEAESKQLPTSSNLEKLQIKYQTVIRFAAVELDGVFSKN